MDHRLCVAQVPDSIVGGLDQLRSSKSSVYCSAIPFAQATVFLTMLTCVQKIRSYLEVLVIPGQGGQNDQVVYPVQH